MYPFQMNAFGALLAVVLVLWTITWKAYGAWTAAKHNHKKWFVAMLILNTVGILEIIYVFYVAKKTWKDVREALKGAWDTIFK